MEIKLAVLADAANVSQEGKLNVMGIFTNIYAHKFPAVHPSMVLVLDIEAHPSEVDINHSVLVKVVDEDGKEIVRIDGSIEIGAAKDQKLPPHVSFTIPLKGLNFARPGVYSFDILIDGRYERSVPLHIALVQQQG